MVTPDHETENRRKDKRLNEMKRLRAQTALGSLRTCLLITQLVGLKGFDIGSECLLVLAEVVHSEVAAPLKPQTSSERKGRKASPLSRIRAHTNMHLAHISPLYGSQLHGTWYTSVYTKTKWSFYHSTCCGLLSNLTPKKQNVNIPVMMELAANHAKPKWDNGSVFYYIYFSVASFWGHICSVEWK